MAQYTGLEAASWRDLIKNWWQFVSFPIRLAISLANGQKDSCCIYPCLRWSWPELHPFHRTSEFNKKIPGK